MKRSLLLLVTILSLTASAQWQPLNGPYGGDISCSVVKGNDIFVGTRYNGIFYSSDQGINWSPRSNGIVATNVTHLAVSQARIFANVGSLLYYSDDDGLTWHQTFPSPIAGMNAGYDYVFVVADGSLYRSSDKGTSWTLMSNDLQYLINNYPINICLSGHKIFISCGYNQPGLYRSLDDGNIVEYISATVSFINFCVRGNELYGANPGIYRSLDDGYSWDYVSEEVDYWANSITLKGTRIYAGFSDGSYYTDPQSKGVYYSDNGLDWYYSGLPGTTVFTITNINNRIFAGASPGGVYRSDDNGSTWTPSSKGILQLGINAMDIRDNRIIAASAGGFVYNSEDGGANWERTGVSINLYNVAAVMTWNNMLFAGNYYSPDNGVTWDTAALSNVTAWAVLNNVFYAGTESFGVYRSDDYGETWDLYNIGLGSGSVYSLKVIGNRLYAGTISGLYVTDGSAAGWTAKNSGFSYNAVPAVGGTPEHLLASNYRSYYFTWDGDIYHSEDQGLSWQKCYGPLNDDGYVSIFEGDGTKDLAGMTGSGHSLLLTDDHGETWSVLDPGFLSEKAISSIKLSGDHIYLSSVNFLNSTDDNTGTSGIYKISTSELVAFRALTDTVFVGTTAGSSAVFQITSSTPWEILEPLPGWFTVNDLSGTGTQQVTVMALQSNPWDPIRYFTMEITSNGIIREVVVAQASKISGIEELNDRNIRIFPNPVASVLNVNVEEAGSFSVSDITGIMLINGLLLPGSNTIDLSGLTKGLYFLTISDEKGRILIKIVKK